MSERLYLYPLWVRLWHWINALMFLVLIITGISMQYSDPGYPLIRFDIAVFYHNLSGVILTISFILFVIMNRISGNYKYYRVKKKGAIIGHLKQSCAIRYRPGKRTFYVPKKFTFEKAF